MKVHQWLCNKASAPKLLIQVSNANKAFPQVEDLQRPSQRWYDHFTCLRPTQEKVLCFGRNLLTVIAVREASVLLLTASEAFTEEDRFLFRKDAFLVACREKLPREAQGSVVEIQDKLRLIKPVRGGII